MKVSWQVTGIGQDAYAKAQPIVPEVEKSGTARGKYLTPVEEGMSESLGIGYGERQVRLKKSERSTPMHDLSPRTSGDEAPKFFRPLPKTEQRLGDDFRWE